MSTSWLPRVHERPPFSATLEAELTKLVSVPVTGRLLGTAVLLAGLAGAALTATTGVTRGVPLAELSPAEVAGTPLPGAVVCAIVVAVWCAATVASEFSGGSIRLGVLAVPNRARLLAAAALVRITMAAAVGVGGTLAAVLGGSLVAGSRGVPVPGMLDPQFASHAVGVVLMTPFYAAVAVGIGFLSRRADVTVGAVLGLMAAPWLVARLPVALGDLLLPWLPGSALQSLGGTAPIGVALPPLAAATVLLCWAATLLGAACAALLHRDL